MPTQLKVPSLKYVLYCRDFCNVKYFTCAKTPVLVAVKVQTDPQRLNVEYGLVLRSGQVRSGTHLKIILGLILVHGIIIIIIIIV